MKPLRLIAAAAVIFGTAAPAMAASLTLTDIQAEWSSSTPTVDGIGTKEIRWGRPAEQRQSGYNFASSETPFSVEDQSEFVIGTFTHENFPVFDQLLEAANLAVQFAIVGVDRPITSTFAFVHQETFNNPVGGACADGGANGTGVNLAGCADKVTATLNREQSESFDIGGVTYVLDILGFQRQGETLTDFWTQESQSNSADLVAVFRVEEGVPVPEVPLPASGILILMGLSTLVLVRRRS